MKDKFIMMGLGEAGSKEMAEVLGNKTCKAIVDHLGDYKEASEKDISKALGIPINTVEYNLKKLVGVGLVEKSKNFFWSVKGKKIVMYKLAKKHVIIGTKKPNLSILKSLLPVLVVVIALALIVLSLNVMKERGNDSLLKQFSSEAEMMDFLKDNQIDYSVYNNGRGLGDMVFTTGIESLDGGMMMATEANDKSTGADEHSGTNIQVQGVDEADIVKNDGKYIYYVSGNSVYIVEAYPVDDLGILGMINVSGIREIFLNDDMLIIFSDGYEKGSNVIIGVYDISDREYPELVENYSLSGRYSNSRMIGENVYVISQEYANLDLLGFPVYSINGVERVLEPMDVSYLDMKDRGFMFTNVMKLDLNGNWGIRVKSFLGGYDSEIYMSGDNLYLTYFKQEIEEDYLKRFAEDVYFPLVSNEIRQELREILDEDISDLRKASDMQEIVYDYFEDKGRVDRIKELVESIKEFEDERVKLTEKTVINRIDLKDLESEAIGKVSGRVLNQFSMHEQGNKFFIATTTGDNWRTRDSSLNHLYSLNRDLKVINSVEDLAKGERIYSVRFMQDRAYVVTFRRTDPLYVIDISDAEDLEVLGYLKITGFSNYLHPYDENHLLGIGQEADENGRTNGLKISLFDVSDVEDVREVAKYVVDGWSSSNAQYDHKAVLFDKAKGILSIPVSSSIQICNSVSCGYDYWQGAYVFNVDEDRIDLRGKVEHPLEVQEGEEEYYWRQDQDAIQRTLFMDDVLYSLSMRKILASDLISLDELNSLDIPFNYDYPNYYEGDVKILGGCPEF